MFSDQVDLVWHKPISCTYICSLKSVLKQQNDSSGLECVSCLRLFSDFVEVVIGAGRADPLKVLAASINFSQTTLTPYT